MVQITEAEAAAYLKEAEEYRAINLEWATVYSGRHPENGSFLMTWSGFGECHITDYVSAS